MGFPATVRNTPTNIGRVLSGQVVVNQGGDTVYLGTSPGEVAQGVQSGVPLFAASALIWNSSGYLWAACPANTNPTIQIQEDGGIPFAAPFVSGEQIQPSGLRSLGFVTGVSGWRLDKFGNVEFNSGIFRGNVVVGPAAGTRIVIDSVAGTITMFNAANQITGQWSAANQSIRTQNGTNTRYMQLASQALAFNPNTALYQGGYVDSADLSGVGRTQVASPFPITGGRPASFDLLSGDAVNQATMFLTADQVVGAGTFLHSDKNVTASITASPIAIAPGTTQVVITITPTCLAGRSYEITGRWQGINIGVPAAYPGNRVTMSIKRGGVSIAAKRILAGAASGFTQEGGTISVTDTPGAGVITYTLEINHETASTAGTAQVNATATAPAELYIRGFA